MSPILEKTSIYVNFSNSYQLFEVLMSARRQMALKRFVPLKSVLKFPQYFQVTLKSQVFKLIFL